MRIGMIDNSSYYYKQREVREQAFAVGGMQEKLMHSGYTMDAADTDTSNADALEAACEMSADEYGFAMGRNTYQYKTLKEQEYNQALEHARVNDPEKYEKMIEERQEAVTKSLRQMEELAGKSSGASRGSATYNGVNIDFNFEYGVMSVGDTSQGDVLSVGPLSSGYVLRFNMENVDSITKILDLFSPEDINKILAEITKFKMAKDAEQELDNTGAEVGQVGEAQADQSTDTGNKTESQSSAEGTGESKTTSEIVQNADGTRNLMITVTIGDTEMVTKIPLPPMKEYSQYRMEKGSGEYEKQFTFDNAPITA